MGKDIFVIIRTEGEYSDRSETPIAYVTSQDNAQLFVTLAEKELRRVDGNMREWLQNSDDGYNYAAERDEIERHPDKYRSKFDPDYTPRYYDVEASYWDAVEASYWYAKVPLFEIGKIELPQYEG